MLNTYYCDERKLVKSNLKNMIAFINKMSYDDCFPVLYHIEEYFSLHGRREYDLYNLKMERCYNMIISSDAEELLLEDNTYVLHVFLIENVIYVGHQGNVITLSFDDGYIKISY